MSPEEQEDAKVAADAIKRRFKQVHINCREESNYWLEHIKKELKPRQTIPKLQQEEVKNDKPKVHLVPLIDRKRNIPSG